MAKTNSERQKEFRERKQNDGKTLQDFMHSVETIVYDAHTPDRDKIRMTQELIVSYKRADDFEKEDSKWEP